MDSKREQALVGVFVLVAIGLLLAALFSISGLLNNSGNEFRAYFKNAGGLAQGTQVRYAGGPPIGRVTFVGNDTRDPTKMEIRFRADASVPVKTDSVAHITSLSPLGDYYLEIEPGTVAAPLAKSGTTLKSVDFVALDQIESEIADLGPEATKLLQNLDARVSELQETIVRVNDLLNKENRANLSASLANVNGLLSENRATIHSTLVHLDSVSAKADPLLDDFKKTIAQANDALSHVDATLLENRPDLRESIKKLREVLTSASSATDQLDRTLSANGEDLDEALENVRLITENLKAFTETIKEHPSSLIRSSGPKPRHPGEEEKP